MITNTIRYKINDTVSFAAVDSKDKTSQGICRKRSQAFLLQNKKTFYNFIIFEMSQIKQLSDQITSLFSIFTFGTFKERSIADTAASAAPAGLPPWPLVVGDPPVTAEVDICWGDTAAEEAPGGKEPTAFVLRTGCFCRLAWYEKNSALLMLFLISQHISKSY